MTFGDAFKSGPETQEVLTATLGDYEKGLAKSLKETGAALPSKRRENLTFSLLDQKLRDLESARKAKDKAREEALEKEVREEVALLVQDAEQTTAAFEKPHMQGPRSEMVNYIVNHVDTFPEAKALIESDNRFALIHRDHLFYPQLIEKLTEKAQSKDQEYLKKTRDALQALDRAEATPEDRITVMNLFFAENEETARSLAQIAKSRGPEESAEQLMNTFVEQNWPRFRAHASAFPNLFSKLRKDTFHTLCRDYGLQETLEKYDEKEREISPFWQHMQAANELAVQKFEDQRTALLEEQRLLENELAELEAVPAVSKEDEARITELRDQIRAHQAEVKTNRGMAQALKVEQAKVQRQVELATAVSTRIDNPEIAGLKQVGEFFDNAKEWIALDNPTAFKDLTGNKILAGFAIVSAVLGLGLSTGLPIGRAIWTKGPGAAWDLVTLKPRAALSKTTDMVTDIGGSLFSTSGTAVRLGTLGVIYGIGSKKSRERMKEWANIGYEAVTAQGKKWASAEWATKVIRFGNKSIEAAKDGLTVMKDAFLEWVWGPIKGGAKAVLEFIDENWEALKVMAEKYNLDLIGYQKHFQVLQKTEEGLQRYFAQHGRSERWQARSSEVPTTAYNEFLETYVSGLDSLEHPTAVPVEEEMFVKAGLLREKPGLGESFNPADWGLLDDWIEQYKWIQKNKPKKAPEPAPDKEPVIV